MQRDGSIIDLKINGLVEMAKMLIKDKKEDQNEKN